MISVDAKQQELVGDFRHGGREWQPAGQPETVRVHDFLDRRLGKALPDGVYAVAANPGWVSVGSEHDPAAFAVARVRRGWEPRGPPTYPTATEWLITAARGGSHSRRTRLWKTELQRLADETGLRIRVCHFPPGTSKGNVIEPRLFCHLTQHWRGRPLVSLEVIVNLSGHTTTRAGLQVRAELDTGTYPTGVTVSDADFAAVQRQPAAFHGDWNSAIIPAENA